MNDPENSQDLLAGYSVWFRAIEVISIVIYCLLTFYLFFWMINKIESSYVTPLIGITVVAAMGADFVSGFVHWMADTWGRPDWFLVGAALIRPFREHHVDQKSITRHDFIEINGSNSMLTLLILLPALILSLSENSVFIYFLVSYINIFCLFIFLTNQIHKWAHLDERGPVVKFFQTYGIILSVSQHSLHHKFPFDTYYSITTGWTNPILSRLKFYRRLENIITYITGAKPRSDDMKWIREIKKAS